MNKIHSHEEEMDEVVIESKAESKLAKEENQKEKQMHIDARDTRLVAVKATIAAAKVEREAKELTGVMETPGAKLDREAKEVKDLAEAGKLNVIEAFGIDSNRSEVSAIADKVNEIIKFLNGKFCEKGK